MLGGKQTVRSTPGKGTTLTVRLELQGTTMGNETRVLIADDHPISDGGGCDKPSRQSRE